MSNTLPSRPGRSGRNLRLGDRSLPGIATLALLLGSAAFASHGANIAITRISNGVPAYANAISHNGHVAGDFDLGTYDTYGNAITHAFLYSSGGQPTQLPLLAANGTNLTSRGLGVNDGGTVVGWGRAEEGGPPHAFRYTGGQTTDLNDTLGASESIAVAVNNNGQILCFATYAAGDFGSVILNPDQSQISIPGMLPYAINSAGHVVGMLNEGSTFSPIFFADSNNDGQAETNEIHHLGTLAGGALDNPNQGGVALNDSDKIVGSLADSNGLSHALLWPTGAEGQVPSDLGAISGESGGAALAINSAGHVVGYSGNGDPFYWTGSGALQQLNALVSESQSASYILYYVTGISDGDLLIGAAAPNQVPPPVGVTVQLGSSQPANTVDLKSVTVPSSVTAPSKLVVTVTMDKKVTGSGVDVSGAYVIGIVNTAFTVHVPANSKTGAVELDTPEVTQDTTARITVSYNGTSLPAKTVTIHPAPVQPAVNGLSITPNPVRIGQKFTAALTLTAAVTKATTIPVGIFAGDNPTGTGSPLLVIKVKIKKNGTGASATAVAPRGTPTGTYTGVAAFGGGVQSYKFSVTN